MDLKGKTALITGATSHGMGRSIAFKFATLGANVVLNYGTHDDPEYLKESAKRAEIVAGHVNRLGGHAHIIPGNTRDEEVNKRLVEETVEKFGSLDILVINAGGRWNTLKLEEITLERWQSCVQAELDAWFLICKHAVPVMRKQDDSRILVMSMNGAMGRKTFENTGIDYTVAKTGRTWLSLALGIDEWDNGIRINIFEIGPMEHISIEKALAAIEKTDDVWEKRDKPWVHDAAEMAAFLVSEGGRFMSTSLLRYPQDKW